jgi:hypothetical protein
MVLEWIMRKILVCLGVLCLVQVFEISSGVAEVNATDPVAVPSGFPGYSEEVSCLARCSEEIFQKMVASGNRGRIDDIWEAILSDSRHGNYDNLVDSYNLLADIFSNELKTQLDRLVSVSWRVEVLVELVPEENSMQEARRKIKGCFALYYDTARMINIIANDLGISEEIFLRTALSRGDFRTVAGPRVLWSIEEFNADGGKERIRAENLEIDRRYGDTLTRYFGDDYVDKRFDCGLGKGMLFGMRDYEMQKEAFVADGQLFSGLGRGDSHGRSADMVTYSFPISQDLLGKFDRVDAFFEPPAPENAGRGGGWKVHVSATVASAEKVADVVIPYLVHNGITFKIVTTASAMRRFYAGARYRDAVSQIGKFITIYPDSFESLIKILRDLDQILNNIEYRDGDFVISAPADEKKFVQSDFVACTGDFVVHSKCAGGISGALSTRYVPRYSGNDDVYRLGTIRVRRMPMISAAAFLAAFPNGHNPFSAAGFTISYHGINLPELNQELVTFASDILARANKPIPMERLMKMKVLKIELASVGFLSSKDSVGSDVVSLLQRTARLRVPLP